MKYTWECSVCSNLMTEEMTIQEYESLDKVTCTECYTDDNVYRVYLTTQLKFVGHGFTGAGGNKPHMDRKERKTDLASSSDAEPI